jgi:hypothetical protein
MSGEVGTQLLQEAKQLDQQGRKASAWPAQPSDSSRDSQVAPAQAVELIQVRHWRSGGCPVNGRR